MRLHANRCLSSGALLVLPLLVLPLLVLACENEDGRLEDGGSGDPIDVPDPVDPPEADPGEYLEGIDAEFQLAAEEFDVPVSILKAVGYVESEWEMVEGQVEFDGLDPAFGTMALRGDNLQRAADLLGVGVEALKTDRAANIRGAAAVLRDMADKEGIDRVDLGAWAPSIATLANIGHPTAAITYIHDHVYGLIRNGLVVTDLAGEVISEIEPEPEVEPNYPPPGSGPVLLANPDYAGAVFRTSPNHSSRPAGDTGKIEMVIIHSCEGAYAGCWGWLVNKNSGVSAHYVVKEDGSEISQLVKEDRKGWHISAKYDKNKNGGQEGQLHGTSSNNFTVGIEHAGFAKQAAWNANLIEQSAKLVCDITKRQGIPRDKYHVVAHGQLQPHNRIDPGPNWPWATYFAKIDAACGAPPPMDPPPMDPPPEDPPPEDPPPEDPPPEDPPPPAPDPAEIIVDSNNGNNDAALAKFNASANWTVTAATPGFYGNNYLFAATAALSDAAEFSFYLNAAGTKKIEIWYTSGGNRAPDAPVVAFDAAAKNLGTAKVNMQAGGKAWVTVGTYDFTAGWNKIAVSRWTTGNYVVIADAIRVTPADGDVPPPPNGDPTADQLLALTQSCTQLPGTTKFKSDANAAATIPICQLDGALWWRADADIDCDGAPDPKCTVDPYYQPETSAKDSKGNFMNSATTPFYVVPLPSNGFDPKAHGIKTSWSGYGSVGAIIYNGKLIYAPYADAGPSGVLGELSYRAAELLGIPPSPINGGVASGVTYIVFTGDSYVNPIESASAAETLGKQRAAELLQNN